MYIKVIDLTGNWAKLVGPTFAVTWENLEASFAICMQQEASTHIYHYVWVCVCVCCRIGWLISHAARQHWRSRVKLNCLLVRGKWK